jgi:uncharacterized membrane protein (DUF485 family)
MLFVFFPVKNSFHKKCLTTYHIPGTVLCPAVTAVSKLTNTIEVKSTVYQVVINAWDKNNREKRNGVGVMTC